MIIANPEQELAKYKHVYTVRQSDWTKLFATRVDQDALFPTLWNYEESHRITSQSTFFTSPVRETTAPLTTEGLLRKAQADGYGDWETEEEETGES